MTVAAIPAAASHTDTLMHLAVQVAEAVLAGAFILSALFLLAMWKGGHKGPP